MVGEMGAVKGGEEGKGGKGRGAGGGEGESEGGGGRSGEWGSGGVEEAIYDIIIIGAGPAGLTAAIYARRRLLNTLVISMDIGGQILLADNIDNFLGYTGRSGAGLALIFERQMAESGLGITMGEVRSVEKEGDLFRVRSTAGDFLTRTVVATGGRAPRKLNVPGEERLFGKGVSTYLTAAVADGRNRAVAIVGGGNTACKRAELLSGQAEKVYLIHRRDQFRSDEITVERLRGCPNVEFRLNTIVEEIRGRERVESILVRDAVTGRREELRVGMVYVDIGRDVNLSYIKGLVRTNEAGRIIVDRLGRTSCEGVFAAGDITDLPYEQAIIAAGAGAIATLAAYDYLKGKGRGTGGASATCSE